MRLETTTVELVLGDRRIQISSWALNENATIAFYHNGYSKYYVVPFSKLWDALQRLVLEDTNGKKTAEV